MICLERADEERKEIEAKLKLKKQQFRDVMKESNGSTKYIFMMNAFVKWLNENILFRTTFTEFSSKHGKDERFRAIEKIRDREAYFHEYVQELKVQEKDGSHRQNDKEKVRHNVDDIRDQSFDLL